MKSIAVLAEREQALTLLKPPRRRILELAQSPISAVELASELGQPRQRIGYHVRKLVAAGLLVEESSKRRGGVVEKRYRASAHAYSLSPELLGSLVATLDDGQRASVAHLLARVGRVQEEVRVSLEQQTGEESPESSLNTLSFDAPVRFRSATQRALFARALETAIAQVVADHTEPFSPAAEAAPPLLGEPYRLTLLCHPLAEPQIPESESP